MHRSPLALAFAALTFLAISVLLPYGANAAEFPWITPFKDGQYIGELLPSGINESDFQALSAVFGGKEVNAIILDAGGAGFESVGIGLYDKNKRDVYPLWTSHLRDGLPFVIKDLPFDEIFIKYNYLPGDKYVSTHFKAAVNASYGGYQANMKVFAVKRDMDYAGVSLKTGDFILCSDSGGGGALSTFGNNDYSDIVFVLRIEDAPSTPMTQAIWLIGGGSLLGATVWSIHRGRRGLRS